MKKSMLYRLGFVVFMSIAAIGVLLKISDIVVGSGMAIAWVCLGTSSILEALGK